MAASRYSQQRLGQRGFTLVELIIVIVVMGILSFGMVQFILNSSDAYSDAARRERMGSTGRAAIEKMAREIRT
ncbi:MAG: prepilin-type N-terminal cleavage/methylation domain-containing protein, partial [Motiliproteus sp.]